MFTLDKDGIEPTMFISKKWVGEINTYLSRCNVYDGHVRRAGNNRPSKIGDNPADCYSLEDMMMAPHILDLALMYSTVPQGYLNPMYLYSINIFNTYPTSNPPIGYIQEFHRDSDDVKFIALFIYLSDILEEKDGPHQYITGTHNGTDTGNIVSMYGVAGTAFYSNGQGLHRGLKPVSGPRRILWIRWGVSAPPRTYVQDGIQPVSSKIVNDYESLTPYQKNMLKLLIREE